MHLKLLCWIQVFLKNAPMEMTIAGFGDVYGKYIAKSGLAVIAYY